MEGIKKVRALALILAALPLTLAVDSSSNPGSPMSNFGQFASSPISSGRNSPGFYPYSMNSRVPLLPTSNGDKKDINTALGNIKQKDTPLKQGTLANSNSGKWRQDLQPGPSNKFNFQAQRNNGKGVKTSKGTSASAALVDKSFGDTRKTKKLANAATRASLATGKKVSVRRHPYTTRAPQASSSKNNKKKAGKKGK